MYKSDIQFIREKYRELAEENNQLRDEIRALKEANERYKAVLKSLGVKEYGAEA